MMSMSNRVRHAHTDALKSYKYKGFCRDYVHNVIGHNEQTLRFNNRKDNDAGRFVSALKSIVNKRITYPALTGSESPRTC